MDVRKRAWNADERAAVLLELASVLASEAFAQSPRRRRFLEFIVSETLANRGGQLKGYRIGLEVFGKPPSFDPVLDPVVRVEAGRLRDRLREYYSEKGLSDPVVITLPKGSYTPEFEFRPPATTVPHTGAAVAAFDIGSPATTVKPSLAVLPFRNVSDDHEHDYLADGLTDTLITDLSKVSGLVIVCRQSSFAFRDSDMPMAKIAQRFKVRYLVLGSVQRSAQRLRIAARVIDSETDATIWAERYDRELGDLFAIEDDVCRSIVQALRITLTPHEAARLGHGGTSNLAAHDTLLRGLERFWAYTDESEDEARRLFTRAIEFDPGYASAHAWLARVLVCRWWCQYRTQISTLEKAFDCATTAVRLDEHLPLAQSMLGWVQLWRKDGDAAVAAGKAAVALDPNGADAHVFLSISLAATGHAEEALRNVEKGMRLSPHPSTFFQWALGQCYFVLEDYERAIAALERGRELAFNFLCNQVFLCLIYTDLGHTTKARIAREEVLQITNDCIPAIREMYIDSALLRRYRRLAERAGLQ